MARTKPRTIRQNGITVAKRWDWTPQRDWEERDNVRKLFRPYGFLRSRFTKLPGETDGRRLAP